MSSAAGNPRSPYLSPRAQLEGRRRDQDEEDEDEEPPHTAYVSFSAEINAHTSESLIAALANCANGGVTEFQLLLSTPGRNVMNGMNLYNVLRAMPLHLVTHNVGNVDSIGNAVFWPEIIAWLVRTPRSCFMASGLAPAPTRTSRRSCYASV
jgi:ClpP protease-like protein